MKDGSRGPVQEHAPDETGNIEVLGTDLHFVHTNRFLSPLKGNGHRVGEEEIIKGFGAGGRGVDHGLHLISVSDADDITELVLDHHQMVEVVVDVRGEGFLVPEAHDFLLGLVGSCPINFQGDLVRLHQDPLPGVLSVQEEMDVAPRLG